jgi:hypothetical protein
VATELLIATNPARRRGKISAKQRAAAMRNLKKARAARKPKRRRNPVAALSANPRRRRKRRRSAARFLRRIKRRRNPSFSLRRFSPRALMAQAMPAIVGGGGAVANDVLYNAVLNFVPASFAPQLVENLRSGQLRHVGKALSAMLLATAAGFVFPRRIAEQMGTGALTVVGYNVVRDVANAVLPEEIKARITLGMYLDPALGYAGAGWNPVYGSNWREKSGLAAYLRSNPADRAEPGTVRVPSQFEVRNQFGRPQMQSVAVASSGT